MTKSDMTEHYQQHVNSVLSAFANKSPRPMLQGPEKPLVETAYDYQKALIRALTDPETSGCQSIRGYKAAFTNAMAQQAMGLSESGLGVLLSGCELAPDTPVQTAGYRRGILETEIGYRLVQKVTEPVDPASVMSVIGEILPVVEIADGGYEAVNAAGRAVTGADFIAANTATASYLPGTFSTTPDQLDAVKVSLDCEGERVFQGTGADASSGQLLSLCWLINKALALGYPLETGHLLMTGSLGRVAPLKAGHYKAAYEGYGFITFIVE